MVKALGMCLIWGMAFTSILTPKTWQYWSMLYMN